MECLWIGTWLIILHIFSASSQQTYRICSSKFYERDCNVLNTGSNSEVRCVTVADSVDCALKLQNNEADFGVFHAEDLLLISNFINNDVQVLYEMVTPNVNLPEYKFQTVAVVRSNHTGGVLGLKGKRYCHPGFHKSQTWTDRVLKELEYAVAEPSCNARGNRSAIEEELYSLTQFFSAACRPGSWSISEYLDGKFKLEYPQLCSLCDDKSKCTYNPNLGTPHQAALSCLDSGRGDVAYVDLQEVNAYFSGHANKNDYSLLCKNGTLANLDTPCAWIQQRWDSVVARTTVSQILVEKLRTWIPAAIEPRALDWTGSLKNILLPENSYVGREVTPITSPQNFVRQGRDIPKIAHCRPTVRWCTTSTLESTKCSWLKEAAVTHGIVPAIECINGISKFDCFNKIDSDGADIVGIDTNLGYIALLSYNLTSAAYQETTNDKNRVIVAIVRQNTTATRVKDLLEQRICFPEFGGLAWITYVESLRKASLLRDGVCAYGKTAESLFSSVCAPGAQDSTYDKKNLNQDANLCGFCEEAAKKLITPFSGSGSTSGTCTASGNNPFYGDGGALRCLHEGGADLAFIDISNLPSLIAAQSFPADQYRIFCQDGRKVALTSQVPEECPFTNVIGGDIVGKQRRSRALSRDISNLLLNIDEWFGYVPRGDENAFHIFNDFNGTSGLLIETSTVAILSVHQTESSHVSSYDILKRSAITCTDKSNSSSTLFSTSFALIVLGTLIVRNL